MKRIPLVLLLILSIVANSQIKKTSKMGQTTLDELKMTVYDKDSTAAALVLFEHANIYLDSNNNYETRTDFYFRIKILDKSAFDLANITINLFRKRRVKDIKAITYNLSETGSLVNSVLQKDKIFEVQKSKDFKSHRFTLPNIKEGSVIEYSYSILSPYLGINDWCFQSKIPKMESKIDAAIIANSKYNVKLVGFLPLDKEDISVDKKCVYIDGIGQGACVVYSFFIKNIPAFKEEDYMLSKKNYISRVTFDLKTHTSPRGIVENYTTTWKEADKKLKKIFFNNQTSKTSFFESKISDSILKIDNKLQRAKSIYTFIQNHFTWNDKYWTNEDAKVKDAFNNKTGSAGEINLSLFNALEAANINADLVILSTRNHGLPTTLFPVIFDFNYVIIRVIIDKKEYYLDATDKFLSFGSLPIRTLNGQARVINFKKESNWVILKPKLRSSKNITASLVLNEDGNFVGNLLIKRQGYPAKQQREKLNTLGNKKYIEEFEEENQDLEVDNFKVLFKDDLEKSLQEIFKINLIMDDGLSEKIRINPYFFDRLKENPFKLKERNYPVNFGYAKRNNYVISLKIPDNYKITKLPKQVAISLPNKGGSFVVKVKENGNVINIYSRMRISKSAYTSNEYFALKEFFNQIVIAENSYITIEKK